MNVLEIMRTGPVIPVIVVERVGDAVPLARALVEGGVRVLELTLRTPAALRAIEAIANEVEGALIGVGTITRAQDFAAARKAGALFGVSPGLTPELIAASRDGGLPLLPGVMTPSEVIAARAAGFTELKLFPAQQAGGVGMLKALAGPFPELNFCPTGGITPASAPEFLALPNVACVGGSWLTPRDAVAAHDWARIRALAAETSRLRESAR
jgi:2-dehydro-3-deoxyphosphogluconate aldolase/(4S)-4-hydroxy-2-oxoglutarate aldolase